MSTEPSTGASTDFLREPKRGGPLSGGFGVLVAVILLGASGYLFYRNQQDMKNVRPVEPQPIPRRFMCTDQGHVFAYGMLEHEAPPVMCPTCKKKNAYPCEACYLNKDGSVKDKPDYVILNHYLGKSGDTICPVCGKVVVGHNPDPRKSKSSQPNAERTKD